MLFGNGVTFETQMTVAKRNFQQSNFKIYSSFLTEILTHLLKLLKGALWPCFSSTSSTLSAFPHHYCHLCHYSRLHHHVCIDGAGINPGQGR